MIINTWNLYFDEEEYTTFNENLKTIEEILEKIEITDTESIVENGIYYISYENLINFLNNENNSDIFKCVGCAVSEIIFKKYELFLYVVVRLTSYGEILNFNFVCSENIGKLVCLSGTVSRIGSRRIQFKKLYFKCQKCDEILNLESKIYKIPSKCKGNCKSKSFVFLQDQSEIRDYQEIKIQEINSNGDVPLYADIILYDDLVGKLIPGDLLTLVGVINPEMENETNYKLVVNVNNIFISTKRDSNSTKLSESDLNEFIEISKDEKLISSLIYSLFPNIYGNEEVLCGILLGLFGGSKKYSGETYIRPEIHILLIGDPGLGKSKILLSACSAMLKSIYVCGNLTTTAGLTVSLSHDPLTGEYIIDAGALVVSDNGLCCIDELDKLEDLNALLEVMEEQSVTIAKGGVHCTIPARSTIIAASNPKKGHFDKKKPLEKNIDFDVQLLSRFDLIFILMDDTEEQNKISSKILQQLYGKEKKSKTDDLINQIRNNNFFISKDENTKIYKIETIRKYISYAKSSITPILSEQAKQILQNFYLECRKQENITIRLLESLIRLTEARTKISLRTIATKSDAEFVIKLFKKTQIKKKNKMSTLTYLKESGKTIFSKDELILIIKETQPQKDPEKMIEIMNNQGYLLKQNNQYKFTG